METKNLLLILAIMFYIIFLWKIVIPYSFNFLGFVPSVLITLIFVGVPIAVLYKNNS